MNRPDGVTVVDSTEGAQELLQMLQQFPGPFGFDTETVGCDPRKQSPVGTARIVCFSVAWFAPDAPAHPTAPDTKVASKAFIWAEYLPLFREWLEDESVHKVGANILSYDAHALRNHGIALRGVTHCNKATSRLWYSSSDVPHDLKSQAGAVLGYATAAYDALFSRCCETAPKVYKADKFYKAGTSRKGPLAGVPTLVIGGSVSTFSHRKRQLIPLDRIREDYPDRVEQLYTYASNDAAWSLELSQYREAQLKRRAAKFGTSLDLYRTVWHPMLQALSCMEARGITVDAAVCEDIRSRAQADMDALMPAIQDFAAVDGFNPGSSDQLRDLIYTRLRCRRAEVKGTMWAIGKPKKDEWSTSEVSLHWLQLKHPEYNEGLDAIRRWRKIRRNMQFGRDLPKYAGVDGRVHTVMGPEADTGRLSCKLPALQQIPSKNDMYGLRAAFVAAPGHVLVVSDFSQLEVYVLAHVLAAIPEIADTSIAAALTAGDVYSWMARLCHPDKAHEPDAAFKAKGSSLAKIRDLMKIVVLARNYGKGTMGMALTLLDELGEPAQESFCQGLFDTFDAALPGIPLWHEWIKRYARKFGGVPSLLGRWRPLPGCRSERAYEAAAGDRQAMNTPMQAGAMDIATLAMLGLNTDAEVPGWFNAELAATGARCLLQVHDELIFEVPEQHADAAMRLIQHGMENPPMLQLKVQLKTEAKYATSWKGAK